MSNQALEGKKSINKDDDESNRRSFYMIKPRERFLVKKHLKSVKT